MNDTEPKRFRYLHLITGNLKLVSSGRWIWKPCFVPQSGIRQTPAIHLAVRLIFRSSTEILRAPGSPRLAAWGSQGPQQFSGWKYLPARRGLAMVNVKRAIFSGLILGLIYKLPCRVNFDSMHYSTLFWKVFQKDSDSSQSFEITFLPAHVHVSSPYATYQLQPTRGNTPVCQNGHKSRQQPLSPWLRSAADKLDSAAGMHLIFTRCEGAPGAWFIAGPQPHDIINTVTIFGNNKSVQQSRLLSSLTWWVQVLPEKTQSSQFAATNDTSSKVTVTAWIPLILLLSLKKPYIENIFWHATHKDF